MQICRQLGANVGFPFWRSFSMYLQVGENPRCSRARSLVLESNPYLFRWRRRKLTQDCQEDILGTFTFSIVPGCDKWTCSKVDGSMKGAGENNRAVGPL